MNSILGISSPKALLRKGAKLPGTCDPVGSLPQALIYRPARHPRQSAPRPRYWLLEFEPSSAPRLEALMGWVSSDDVLRSFKIKFPDRESAITFAESQGWQYQLFADEPKKETAELSRKQAPNEKKMPRIPHPIEPYDTVEQAGLESFPCSDPPAWTGVLGCHIRQSERSAK